MNTFCPEGSITNPKCYTLETNEFDSEEQIFDILLDVLKSELPAKMALLTDCSNKPMYISEDNIDIVPDITRDPHFEVTLNPLSATPKYPSDLKNCRDVVCEFELILTVHNELPKCLTWELLRFKNAVDSLIRATELVIDGYDTVYVEEKGFTYYLPEQIESAMYMRQGSYRFAVTITQFKTN